MRSGHEQCTTTAVSQPQELAMNVRRVSIAFLAATTLAACGKDQPALDESLRQDLSLASQAYAPQLYASPLEAGYAPTTV